MTCSTAIRAVFLATVMGLCAPAFADDTAGTDGGKPVAVSTQTDQTHTQNDTDLGFQTGADADQDAPIGVTTGSQARPVSAIDDVPEEAMAIAHIDITVETKHFSVRSRRTATGGVLLEADPIFTHLKGKVSIEGTVLSYLRYQDGANLAIDMATGAASINGQVRGFLPGWKAREVADTWLGPNAIAFLTGTEPKEDSVGRWMFTLSDQLRPQFDLDLWIEGEQITNPALEPRTIGPVLLIPLEEVTTALGHTLERLDGNVVSVRRLQDSATILLNLSNGLVAVNNTPRGVTPNISFADPETLLLPSSAVETLTGTNIELEPGSDRIIITLDDRLGGGVLPGARVVDEVAQTGFTPEALDFQVSDRGPVNLTFSSRYRSLNTQLRYDSAGGIDNIRELQPAFVGLNVQSLSGWVGSIGDANTRLRELSGVGGGRVRGVTWRKQNQESGNIVALAAGAPTNGSTQITPDATRPDFGGFVAGARILKADRSQDIGVGLSITEGGQAGRFVIGGQKSFLNGSVGEDKRLLEGVFVSGDTGVFYSPDGVKVDVRGRVQARAKLASQIGLQANVNYEGGRFRQSDQELADAAEAGRPGPASAFNFNAAASADWRSAKAWGPLDGIAAGVRTTHTRTGGDTGTASTSVGGSVNGQIPAWSLSLSADASYSTSDAVNSGDLSEDVRTNSRSFGARALKRFDWGQLTVNYSNVQSSGTDTTSRLVSSLNVRPIRRNFGNGGTIAASPSASVVVADGKASARFGATVSANSGQIFGPKLNLQGQISALQSVDPDNNDTQIFSTLAANYRLTRNIQLEASYVETFSDSRDFSIAVRGRVPFNEPRKYSQPKDGLGVLKGVVYFDRNRDGVRQKDEPGVSSVRVQVTGTRLGLSVDRDGRFTIQNIKKGLYGLTVDRRSLPLGLVVPDDVSARATIAEGRITDLEIPIIASGQIRGAVFVDSNANGKTDPGERRIEGTYVTLKSIGGDVEAEPVSQIAASFGQYSFENLAPGQYELSVNFKGIVHTQMVELKEDNLFEVVPFGLPDEEGAGQAPIQVETIGEA